MGALHPGFEFGEAMISTRSISSLCQSGLDTIKQPVHAGIVDRTADAKNLEAKRPRIGRIENLETQLARVFLRKTPWAFDQCVATRHHQHRCFPGCNVAVGVDLCWTWQRPVGRRRNVLIEWRLIGEWTIRISNEDMTDAEVRL